mgnify:FL=1
MSLGPRILPIMGKSLQTDVVEWTGVGMKGTAGVYRASSPTIHYSPELERQRAIENAQLGLITGEELKDALGLPSPEMSGYGLRNEHAAFACNRPHFLR